MDQSWYTVKQLDKNVWGFGEFKHPEKVISYLIIGKSDGLLIDTGLGINNIRKEIEKVTKLPILVINTHKHFDHVGGNKIFPLSSIINNRRHINLPPYYCKVLKTPGHTPDSICIYEISTGYLFSGDTIYPGPIYMNMNKSNVNDYFQSLKRLNKLKISKIFPGHNQFNCSLKIIKQILDKLADIQESSQKLIVNRSISIILK